MVILGICSEPTIINVIRIIVLFINIIKVLVPIILILSLMIKFASAITKNDNEVLGSIKKAVVPNIIAAVLIFLVPTLIDLVVKVSFPNSEYSKCISGISKETIKEAYNNKMDSLISKAEESLNISDYNNAYIYLHNIADEEKKQEYENKLKSIKEKIDEIEK